MCSPWGMIGVHLHERKIPTDTFLHQEWELLMMKYVIFYPSHIFCVEHCTQPSFTPETKTRRLHLISLNSSLSWQRRWRTLHSGRCKVEWADGGCSCSCAEEQPGDWLVSPSGPCPSQWGIHSQVFSLWQLIRLGSNQSQRFTLLLLWLLPLCVFPHYLNLNCPPGNLSAVKETKGHWKLWDVSRMRSLWSTLISCDNFWNTPIYEAINPNIRNACFNNTSKERWGLSTCSRHNSKLIVLNWNTSAFVRQKLGKRTAHKSSAAFWLNITGKHIKLRAHISVV